MYPVDSPITGAFNGTMDVDQYDLIYHATDDVRAADQVSAVSEVADQATFAAAFLGLANERKTAAMTASGQTLDVIPRAIRYYPCVSSTFELGDYVAATYDGGSALVRHKVKKTATATSAIGYVVKREASAVTKVLVAFISRLVPPAAVGVGTTVSSLTDTGAATIQGLTSLAEGTLAAAGTNQGTAGAIVKTFNYVTAADGTKGVALPAPAAGLVIFVQNTATNKPLKVYPNATETIDGGSSSAAVTVPPGRLAIFWSDATNWVSSLASGGLQPYGTLAAAGSTQGDAGAIVTETVTVTAADGTKGVKLPAPAAGLKIKVVNTVATALLKVYGNASETVDGIGGAAGITVLAGKTADFISDGTNWFTEASAVGSGLIEYASLAATGTNQGTAAAIASLKVKVTAADGTKAVKLPAPTAGLMIEVDNTVNTKSLPVFGNATETVQGVAGATGVKQPAGSMVRYFSDGTNWYASGAQWDFGLIAFDTTAPAGSTSADAAQILGTVYWPASGGVDGTKGSLLPAPAPGLTVTVINDHATNALKIYSASGNIDGTIGTTAKSVAGTKVITFRSDGTNWRSQLTA